MSTLSKSLPGAYLSAVQARELIAQACPAKDYKDKKVLLIVRMRPHLSARHAVRGTLRPDRRGDEALRRDDRTRHASAMSEEAICERLEISLEERRSTYAAVRFFNHEWDKESALRKIGDLTVEDTRALTGGLLEWTCR